MEPTCFMSYLRSDVRVLQTLDRAPKPPDMRVVPPRLEEGTPHPLHVTPSAQVADESDKALSSRGARETGYDPP